MKRKIILGKSVGKIVCSSVDTLVSSSVDDMLNQSYQITNNNVRDLVRVLVFMSVWGLVVDSIRNRL
jgi:hypothetical protein